MSKELNDYFTEHWIKNYFNTTYEQWQSWLAEASINSVTMLGRTVMAESGILVQRNHAWCELQERNIQ